MTTMERSAYPLFPDANRGARHRSVTFLKSVAQTVLRRLRPWPATVGIFHSCTRSSKILSPAK